MKTLTMTMNDEVLAAVRQNPDEFTRDMRFTAASTWYAEGKISQEVAASMAGMDRVDFLHALGDHRIESFHVDIDELKRDLAND